MSSAYIQENEWKKKYEHFIILNNEGNKGKLHPTAQKENIQSCPAQQAKRGDRVMCREMQKQQNA